LQYRNGVICIKKLDKSRTKKSQEIKLWHMMK